MSIRFFSTRISSDREGATPQSSTCSQPPVEPHSLKACSVCPLDETMLKENNRMIGTWDSTLVPSELTINRSTSPSAMSKYLPCTLGPEPMTAASRPLRYDMRSSLDTSHSERF